MSVDFTPDIVYVRLLVRKQAPCHIRVERQLTPLNASSLMSGTACGGCRRSAELQVSVGAIRGQQKR